MRMAGWRTAAVVVGSLFPIWGAHAADFPQAARDAVENAFPNAVIQEVGRETENGVRSCEVNLLLNGKRIEVEVHAKGDIGELERRIGLDETPKTLVEALREATGGDLTRARIERHERSGVAWFHQRTGLRVRATVRTFPDSPAVGYGRWASSPGASAQSAKRTFPHVCRRKPCRPNRPPWQRN